VLYGPRQVGKTTLAQKLLEESGRKTIQLSGDDPRIKPPASWKDAYPEAAFSLIHPKNYLDFVAPK